MAASSRASSRSRSRSRSRASSRSNESMRSASAASRDRAMGEEAASPARSDDSNMEEPEAIELLTAREKELLWREIVFMEDRLKETEASVEGIGRREQQLVQHEERVREEEAKEEQIEKKIREEAERMSRDRREHPNAQHPSGRRPRAGAASAPGGRRMLAGMLGLLSKEKDRLTSETSQTARKLERQKDLERRVREKDHRRAVENAAKQRETLTAERKAALETILTLREKIIASRGDWAGAVRMEQQAAESQFLKVVVEGAPAVFWTPAKHNAATEAAVGKRRRAVARDYRQWRSEINPKLAHIKKDGYHARQRRMAAERALPQAGQRRGQSASEHSDTERVVFN